MALVSPTQSSRSKSSSHGFTMLEMLVTLVVMGVMAGVVVVGYAQVVERAHHTASQATLVALSREVQTLALFEYDGAFGLDDFNGALEDLADGGPETGGVFASSFEIVAVPSTSSRLISVSISTESDQAALSAKAGATRCAFAHLIYGGTVLSWTEPVPPHGCSSGWVLDSAGSGVSAGTPTPLDDEEPVIPDTSSSTSSTVPAPATSVPDASTSTTLPTPPASVPDGSTTTSTTVAPVPVESPLYDWQGFSAPEEAPILNLVNAGRALPIKFSIGGFEGYEIFETGFPASQEVSCVDANPVSEFFEEATPGASGTSYHSGNSTYQWVWDTSAEFAGQCRRLMLRLADGSDHWVYFQFRSK